MVTVFHSGVTPIKDLKSVKFVKVEFPELTGVESVDDALCKEYAIEMTGSGFVIIDDIPNPFLPYVMTSAMYNSTNILHYEDFK